MSKFDEVYKKLIYESTATDIVEDDLTAVVLDNNQFYNNYLSNLAVKTGVVVVKARFDTFRVYGVMNNIIKFFKDFKVDNNYFDNEFAGQIKNYEGVYDPVTSADKTKPSDFVLFKPLVCIVDQDFFYHQMNDPGNEKYFTDGNYIPTREDLVNVLHRESGGRWNMIKVTKEDDNLEYDLKESKPADLAKVLADIYDSNLIGIVEFTINSKHLPNYVWEEDSFYWSGDEAVQDVLDNQLNESLQCKMPIINDKEYQNKSLAEKTIDYNPTNKVSVKTLKTRK